MNQGPQRANLEIKARLGDLAEARGIAEELATHSGGTLWQRDTYFCTPRGRLKLREFDGEPPQLIGYSRDDQAGPKTSLYYLVPVLEPEALREALASVLGTRCVVTKRRELYFYDEVRIHLDEVESLGSFLELEAVLGDRSEAALAQAQAKVERLMAGFGIAASDLVSESYVDLMETG